MTKLSFEQFTNALFNRTPALPETPANSQLSAPIQQNQTNIDIETQQREQQLLEVQLQREQQLLEQRLQREQQQANWVRQFDNHIRQAGRRTFYLSMISAIESTLNRWLKTDYPQLRQLAHQSDSGLALIQIPILDSTGSPVTTYSLRMHWKIHQIRLQECWPSIIDDQPSIEWSQFKKQPLEYNTVIYQILQCFERVIQLHLNEAELRALIDSHIAKLKPQANHALEPAKEQPLVDLAARDKYLTAQKRLFRTLQSRNDPPFYEVVNILTEGWNHCPELDTYLSGSKLIEIPIKDQQDVTIYSYQLWLVDWQLHEYWFSQNGDSTSTWNQFQHAPLNRHVITPQVLSVFESMIRLASRPDWVAQTILRIVEEQYADQLGQDQADAVHQLQQHFDPKAKEQRKTEHEEMKRQAELAALTQFNLSQLQEEDEDDEDEYDDENYSSSTIQEVAYRTPSSPEEKLQAQIEATLQELENRGIQPHPYQDNHGTSITGWVFETIKDYRNDDSINYVNKENGSFQESWGQLKIILATDGKFYRYNFYNSDELRYKGGEVEEYRERSLTEYTSGLVGTKGEPFSEVIQKLKRFPYTAW